MEPENPEKPFADAMQVEIMINNPHLTEAETIAKCQSVLDFQPACVWVKPCYLQVVTQCLRRKGTLVGTVIGCPDGSNTTQVKLAEAKRALTEGATRLSMPINLGYVRERRLEALFKDLHAISGIAHMNGAGMEASFDPAYLNMDDILQIVQASLKAKVDTLSFPLVNAQKIWDFTLVDLLNEILGGSIPLKGLIQQADSSDLPEFLRRGLARVGIRDFSFSQ
jgi:deoxyribose-phosphate aldolase